MQLQKQKQLPVGKHASENGIIYGVIRLVWAHVVDSKARLIQYFSINLHALDSFLYIAVQCTLRFHLSM